MVGNVQASPLLGLPPASTWNERRPFNASASATQHVGRRKDAHVISHHIVFRYWSQKNSLLTVNTEELLDDIDSDGKTVFEAFEAKLNRSLNGQF